MLNNEKAIHLNHINPKKHPLGAKLYKDLKEKHPRQQAAMSADLPAPPVGDIIRPGLSAAIRANSGTILKSRAVMMSEINAISDINCKELDGILSFFIRLSMGCFTSHFPLRTVETNFTGAICLVKGSAIMTSESIHFTMSALFDSSGCSSRNIGSSASFRLLTACSPKRLPQ